MTILILMIIAFSFSRKNKDSFTNSKSNNKRILSNSTHEFYPTTLVISLDGFHPHYINPHLTPTLHEMMLNDYGAPYMIPSFPSSTFPNHWTLVTGLYPSEHGIVGNTFYDPILDKQFVNTDPKQGGLDPDFWQGGEPIWSTAFKQGVNSAIHMWPGSEVSGVGIGGGPLDVDKYNGSEVLSSKVNRVMNWLDREEIELRPELILTYVPTIDQFGHKFGINGSDLKSALTYVDDFVDLMQMELMKRNLKDIVNLIIVSDHGMAPTSNNRLLYLDDVIDLKMVQHVDGWPLFGLRPSSEFSTDDIQNEIMKNIENIDPNLRDHYRILRTEGMPVEWQFGGKEFDHKFNYRLAPIWIIPDVGYAITTKKQMEDNNFDYRPKGVHGYNNTELLMRALFLGSGPYFREKLPESDYNYKIKPFPNTEVYNLICDTLDLIPAPNNGTSPKDLVSPLLSSSNLLPYDWTDNLQYPDLPFEVEHVVEDATYDLLWKKPTRERPTSISISTNMHPYESLVSEESLFSSMDIEKVPKPTDLFDSEPTQSDKGNSHNLWEEIDDKLEDILDKIGESFQDTIDKVDDWIDDALGDDNSDSGDK
mmetsp:Transcript_6737/g.6642  ORF Transcript_6737/g.6642 Transcript_6737/m.6642 type:complete len:591 (-) Transcript_6737:46-1818(-)